MADTKKDLGDQNQQKDGQVNRVATYTGQIEDGPPGFRTSWCASNGTVLFSHANGGLVVGVLKSIVDECCARDIPL